MAPSLLLAQASTSPEIMFSAVRSSEVLKYSSRFSSFEVQRALPKSPRFDTHDYLQPVAHLNPSFDAKSAAQYFT